VHLHLSGRSKVASSCGFGIPSSKEFLGRVDCLKRPRLRSSAPSDAQPLEICCCIADTRRLGPKKLENILTDEGKIGSNQEETTKASVFAVFDKNKKLQYIGFSKGLQDSLRTVFTRRPDKAYYYKSANLTKLDQKEMIGIRDAWFEEVGGPPVGNKLALERAAWQQPLVAGANSNGVPKAKAAEDAASKLLEEIRSRGCTEEFMPNPEGIPQGHVDLVLVDSMTEEEIEEKRAKMEAVQKATRYAKAIYQEEETDFSVLFKQEILTNGGTMFDVVVSHDDEDTAHRIIVGDDYYAPHGLEAKEVVMLSFAFVIEQELERQTEGLLIMTQFPINYFTVADLDQRFPEFRDHFQRWTGITLSGDKFWRFMRVEDYGAALEELEGYESPLPKYGETPLLTGYD